MKLFEGIVRIIVYAIDAYKKYQSNKRLDDIRNDPGTEFLHKFGGSDERTTTSTDTREDDTHK